jgi:hypothetical protein
MLWGAIFGVGFTLLSVFLQSMCLKVPGAELSRGTRRVADNDDGVDLIETEEQNETRKQALNAMNTSLIQGQNELAKDQSSPDVNVSMNEGVNQSNNNGDFISVNRPSLSAVSSAALASQQLSQMNNKSIGGKPMLQTLAEKLPFSPTCLSFHDITYTVQVKHAVTGDITDKILLRSVDGIAKPGNLVALMYVFHFLFPGLLYFFVIIGHYCRNF